jgi:hypothetical protein
MLLYFCRRWLPLMYHHIRPLNACQCRLKWYHIFIPLLTPANSYYFPSPQASSYFGPALLTILECGAAAFSTGASGTGTSEKSSWPIARIVHVSVESCQFLFPTHSD